MLTIVPRKWGLLRDHKGRIWTRSAANSGCVSTEIGSLWQIVPWLFVAPFVLIYHVLFVRPLQQEHWCRDVENFAAQRREYEEGVSKRWS